MKFITQILCFLAMVFACGAQNMSESSAAPESSHLFSNSTKCQLHELTVFNSSTSTGVYLHVYNTYCVANPTNDTIVSDNLANAQFNLNNQTWATGTKVRFTDTAGMTEIYTNRDYWLISGKYAQNSYNLASSLSDAVAGVPASRLPDQWEAAALYVSGPVATYYIAPTNTLPIHFKDRYFSDGIYAVFSTASTNFVASTNKGIFDASYSK